MKAESSPVKILLLEDNEVDAEWVRRALETSKRATFQVEWVDRVEKAIGLIQKQESFDIIISDLKLPDGFGLEVYDSLHRVASHIPIVLLTGTLEEEAVALEAIQKGAQDYLLKGRIDAPGLHQAIRYAMERKRVEERLRVADQKLKEKVQELETMNRVMMDREERNLELKEENEILRKQLGEKKP